MVPSRYFKQRDEISYPAPGNPQPITAEPRITTHPIKGLYVAFGTGKMFEPTDPSILQTQGIYVLWDQNNILPLTKSQLQRIRLQEFSFDHDSNAATPDEIFRRFNGGDLALYDWNDKGFYIPLINSSYGHTGRGAGHRITGYGRRGDGFYKLRANQRGRSVHPGWRVVPLSPEFGGYVGVQWVHQCSFSMGRRVQPGLVSSAPPIYLPQTPTVGTVDTMNAADVTEHAEESEVQAIGHSCGKCNCNRVVRSRRVAR